MKFDKENSMINKNYSINNDLIRTLTDYKKEAIDKGDKKSLIKSTDKQYKKRENYKVKNQYSILAQESIDYIDEFLKISNIESSI